MAEIVVLGDRYIYSSVGTQILYIDANILYGWAMRQYLPTGDFERLSFSDDNIQQDYGKYT